MNKHKWYDVIVAWAEGKPIQYRFVHGIDSGQWRSWPDSTPAFDSGEYEWRVKPEPKEFWIAEGAGKVMTWGFSHPYFGGKPYPDAIKVRQVEE